MKLQENENQLQETARSEFIAKIAAAIYRGRLRTHPITHDEAVIRAKQVADALPQLFENTDRMIV